MFTKRSLFCALIVLMACTLVLSMTSCKLFKRGETKTEKKPEPAKAQETPEFKPTQPPVPSERTDESHPKIIPQASNVLKKICFDYDKSDIREDQRPILDENAKYLLDNADVKILIEGHCDERGSVEYNFALGERRANSTRAYLVIKGVKETRIATISKGEEEPVDPGHTEDAWAKNRRSEFIIIK